MLLNFFTKIKHLFNYLSKIFLLNIFTIQLSYE